ncbi:MAG: hypothetical protein GY720_13560 [bacterium]|nr:hypothetical protein [bacterium]
MTWHRSIWILLGAFLGFGATTALVAIVIGPGDDIDTTTGWIVLGLVGLAQVVTLTVLRPRWFTRPPSHIAGAVLTGVFLRIAIGELTFVAGFMLFFWDLANVAMLLAGLVVSIVLIWLFAAPSGPNILMLQDQLERIGGQGDVAAELAAARGTAPR